MTGEWQLYHVADLIANNKLFIGDGYRAKNEELSPHGIPFARVGNINDGFHFDEADHFPVENLSHIGNKISQPWDVVFTSKGTVGRFAIVRPDTPRFVYSPQLCFWRSLDKDAIDPNFLYYWMLGREFFLQFKGVAAQTDMAEYVSLTDQRRMHITLPRLSEQRAIARILGTLDDKIELNRKMNQTLETMARAIFKSWFVGFDPVRAKAEGRDTGLPPDLAAHFPDSFEDSELGEIPKGWTLRPFSEIVQIISGGTPKTSVAEYWDGNIPWFSVVDAPDVGDVYVVNTEKMITQAGLDNSAAQLLPEGTTIITARGTVGKVALVGIPMAMNQSCYGLFGVESGPSFTYFATRTLVSILKQHGHGSVFNTITRDTLAGVNFVSPSKRILEAFEPVVAPMMQRIKNNLIESRTLATLRDALLPKLLSGELEVGKLAIQMEA